MNTIHPKILEHQAQQRKLFGNKDENISKLFSEDVSVICPSNELILWLKWRLSKTKICEYVLWPSPPKGCDLVYRKDGNYISLTRSQKGRIISEIELVNAFKELEKNRIKW